MDHSKEQLLSNLELWEKSHDPLPEINSFWEFCKTGKKEQLNLRKGEDFLHSPQNIDVEVRQWVGLFDPNKTEWLVVFGVGLGYYYLGLKNWLAGNPKRHVIFIEDDPSVLHAFFETDTAEGLLKDPQAHLMYLPSENMRVPEFEELIQKSLFRELHIAVLASYQQKKQTAYENLSFLIKFFRGIHEATTAEYLTLGKTFFKNFYHNILELDSTINGTNLIGKFKGMPAIICAAGPSLEKNIEVLKTLKDRALILAGGTAMNALNAYGFLPHFGCGIDPFSFHYSRILSNTAFETPFFFRSRMNAEGVALLQGPRIYLPGTTGYPIAEWIDEELKYSPFKIDEGSNVINTSLSIAEKLGCNPIIFVGLDLAYSDGLSYAPGITSHGILDPREQFVTKSKQDELILVKDIYGQPIYTLMKWIVESSWYASFARNFPDVKLVNCTEGGIGFQGVENIPLKTAVELYLQKPLDCEGEIASALLTPGNPTPSIADIKTVLAKLVEDLSLCAEKMTAFQAANPELWSEKLPNTPEFEQELEKLPAYQFLLKPFDLSYQKYMSGTSSHGFDAKQSDLQELLKGRFPYLADILVQNLKYIQKAIKRKLNVEYAKKMAHGIKNEEHPRQSNIVQGIPSMHYYPSGKVLASICYSDGIKQGTFETYAEDGQILSSLEFNQGLPVGVHLYYYPDGMLKSRIPYVNGQLDGDLRLYYSNGILKRSCHYQMGKREGEDLLFYISSAPLLKAEYKDDKPIGTATMWYIDGPISKEVTYFTPGVIAEIKRWDPSGQPVHDPERQLDYIDTAVIESMHFQNSISGMSHGLDVLMHSLQGDFSDPVKNDLENDIQSVEEQMNHLKDLSAKLLETSGLGSEGKEAIWKTPSHEGELHAFLQGITSPMQEAMLKLQWQLRSMIKDIEKKPPDE